MDKPTAGHEASRDARPASHQDRSQNSIESQSDIILEYTADGCLTYLNNSYCENVGRVRGDLIGTSVFEVVHEEQVVTLKSLLGRISRELPCVTGESQLLGKGGDLQYFEWSSTASFDREGKISSILSIGRDVTARVRAARELAENEMRFRDFAEAGADRFWETDKNHRYIYMSPPSGAMKRPSEELIGELPWDVSARQHSAEDDNDIERAFESQMAFRGVRNIGTTPDGHKRHLYLNGVPFHDENGNFAGFRGSTTDETLEVQARQQASSQERQFLDAIEYLTDSVSIYDSELRLVATNSRTRQDFGAFAHLMNPGTPIAEVLAVYRDHIIMPDSDPGSLVSQRMVDKALNDGFSNNVVQYRDGRWISTNRYRTVEGGMFIYRTDITERVEAETALKQSEARLRAIIDNAPFAISLKDPKGVYLEANSRFLEGVERPWSDITGKTAPEIFPAEFGQQIVQMDHEVISGGVTSCEIVEIHDDVGSPGTREVTRFPIIDENNKITGVGVVSVDITARKQAESALKESEENFRLSFEESSIGMTITTPAGGFLDVNPAICSMLGYSEADLLSKSILDITYPDDRARTVQDRQESISGKPTKTGTEKRYRTKNGEIVWGSITRSVVSDDNGNPLYILGQIQDITTRRALENSRQSDQERLRTSEATFRSVFDNAGVGIALRSFDRSVRRHNQTFCEIVGYSADELRRMELSDIAHPSDDPELTSLRHLSFEDTDSYTLERCFIHKDGRTVCCNVSYSVVRDDEGKPISTIAVYQDVTEKKLVEDQLKQAQKMEALGQLTGGVAHEFNNILMAITGNLEMVTDELTDNVRGLSMANTAQRAALRGAELTSNLLSYVGKHSAVQRTIDVNATISEVAALLRPTLGETVRISSSLASIIWNVNVDEGQLRDALINLALNARDAMPTGGEIIFESNNMHLDEDFSESQPYEVKPGDYVMISVADNGEGMTPDVMERAFDPFFTTKGVGAGTGLGLSMVYGFVKRQVGGYIDIETNEGIGTKISIYLPRAELSETESPIIETEAAKQRTGTGTILIVEDNYMVADSLRAYLEKCGYSVLVAENGPEALAVMRQSESIDLVLCDVVLPDGMSGPEVIQTIRPDNPNVKVLYMTGYADEQILASNTSEDEQRVLHKPFPMHQLAEMIADELDIEAKN